MGGQLTTQSKLYPHLVISHGEFFLAMIYKDKYDEIITVISKQWRPPPPSTATTMLINVKD